MFKNYYFYAIPVFVSAFLIFLIQPLIGKVLLPYLGGVAQMWNVAMFSYQLLLLLGYLYAHFLNKYFSVTKQIQIHIVVLLLSLLLFPISVIVSDIDFVVNNPTLWMLLTIGKNIALFFVLLSANTLIIQNLVANTRLDLAKNPYILYAASNFGSFLALILYPIAIEPLISVSQTIDYWSFGYGLFIFCFIAAAYHYFKNSTGIVEQKKIVDKVIISNFQRLKWVALAFLPSALMLSLTHYVASEFSSFPFLWNLILAIYLLTFVLAFAGREKLFYRCLNSHVALVLLLVILFIFNAPIYLYIIPLHLLGFFIISYMCHYRLASSVPHKSKLTEFYIFMAIGGMVGGAFETFFVTMFLKNHFDYILLIILSCFARPKSFDDLEFSFRKNFVLLLILFAVISLILYSEVDIVGFLNQFMKFSNDKGENYVVKLGLIVILFSIFYRRACKRRLLQFLSVLMLFGSVQVFSKVDSNVDVYRNFYGVTKVAVEGNVRKIFSGITNHGAQMLDGGIFYSYYRPAFDVVKKQNVKSVGVVGLGAGILAAVGDKDTKIDFFEINPQMVEIANNKKYFTYISNNKKKVENIKVGDGRLLLEREKKRYDLLVIDAYNSDSIPVHLLTKEAFEIYLNKINSKGILMINISSRYYNLLPVINGAVGYLNDKNSSKYKVIERFFEANGLQMASDNSSRWVMVSEDEALIELKIKEKWKIAKKKYDRVWSDDYVNIFQVTLF